MSDIGDRNRDAYIDLIKRSVTNYPYLGGGASFEDYHCVEHYDVEKGEWNIAPELRPTTLLSKAQLDLIERSVVTIEEQGVPGDLLEAGIWRGGAIVLMRALLGAYEIPDRRVFAADSFAGIPQNTRFRHDPVDSWSDRWVASLDEVRDNIARFGLLDDRVEFVAGFFSDSLKGLAGRRLALIRLDSDSYDSVETSLEYLYPLLSQGGIVIVDDWHLLGCRMAVADYRSRHEIKDEMLTHGGNGYWVKQQEYGTPVSP